MERLSALDASFLYLEKPHVHMHVAGVVILDPSARPGGQLTFEEVRDLVARRIHLVPRFRQRIVFPPFSAGRPVWVDDEDFDIDFHLRRSALPAPGGKRELCDAVQRIHSRPLDRTKPLWEMYLFEGLEGGHVALLAKSHHCLIDGMSGIDIATVMFDFTPEPQPIEAQPWAPRPAPSRWDLVRNAVADQVSDPLRTARGAAELLVRAPQAAAGRVRDTLSGLATVFARGAAPEGPFNRAVGPNRRWVVAEVPVADAKLIKNALGGTVNDVILTAVAGALRRLLVSRGVPTEEMYLRAMVPVSTRDPSQQMALGNQVSNFFVDLPVGPMDAAERLRRITATTAALKSSHAAVAAEAIMTAGRWAPPTLHALAARLVARQRFANLVVSNVPGPQVPLYLAGAQMAVTYPVMPLGEAMALSVAVTSLSGTMGFGFTTDWDSAPDIETLPAGLLDAFDELKKAAGR